MAISNPTWPARPFDPDCTERVPIDDWDFNAIRKLVTDFERERPNWDAVWARIKSWPAVTPAELRELTPHKIGQLFVVSGDGALSVTAARRTATQTMVTFPAAGRKKAPDKIEWLVRAMLLVREEPSLPNAEIARRVKIHASRLSRSPEYRTLAQSVRASIPRGHIKRDDATGQTDVEAYADD
jgi:hypothetical protein